MTINEHISHIQSVINKGLASDDKRVSDEHIYHLMKIYRARLLWEKNNKGQKINVFNYQTIPCLPLIPSELNDCDCYSSGCIILRSKYKLPTILNGRNKMLIKVTTLNGDVISETTISKQKYNKYKKTKFTGFYYILHNGYLFIIGDLRLKVVTVTFLLEDPLELSTICDCSVEGEELESFCYDPLNEDFPLDSELTSTLYKLVLEDMGLLYRYSEDNENNSKSNEVAQEKE